MLTPNDTITVARWPKEKAQDPMLEMLARLQRMREAELREAEPEFPRFRVPRLGGKPLNYGLQLAERQSRRHKPFG